MQRSLTYLVLRHWIVFSRLSLLLLEGTFYSIIIFLVSVICFPILIAHACSILLDS